MQQSAVYIGAGQTRTGQIYYFYGYQERFYASEIEVKLSHIPILVGRESQTKKKELQKDIERIKAMAESEKAASECLPPRTSRFLYGIVTEDNA